MGRIQRGIKLYGSIRFRSFRIVKIRSIASENPTLANPHHDEALLFINKINKAIIIQELEKPREICRILFERTPHRFVELH